MRLPEETWLARMHSPRLRRFHPEHSPLVGTIPELAFFRVKGLHQGQRSEGTRP